MDARHILAEYPSASPSWSPDMPGLEPPADNILINGRNVFNCSGDMAAR